MANEPRDAFAGSDGQSGGPACWAALACCSSPLRWIGHAIVSGGQQPQVSLESTFTSNGASLSRDRASPGRAPLRRDNAEPAVAMLTST